MAGHRPGKRLAQSKGLIFPAPSPVRSVTRSAEDRAAEGIAPERSENCGGAKPQSRFCAVGEAITRGAQPSSQRDIPAGSHIAVKHRKRDVIL